MDKFTQKQIEDAPANPIFEGLSDELKDPKKFKSIEKKIANTMVADHKHRTVKAFVNCKRCQARLKKKQELLKGLGFKDTQQYQMWKKVMSIISNKEEIVLYEKE